MTILAEVENHIRHFSTEELAEFRQWYLEFDNQLWDKQIEQDINMGKLEALANKAILSHKNKQTQSL